MNNIFSCEKKIIDLNSKDAFSIETFMNENMLKLSQCDYDEQKQIIRNAPMIALNQISRNGSMYEDKMIIDSFESPLSDKEYLNNKRIIEETYSSQRLIELIKKSFPDE